MLPWPHNDGGLQAQWKKSPHEALGVGSRVGRVCGGENQIPTGAFVCAFANVDILSFLPGLGATPAKASAEAGQSLALLRLPSSLADADLTGLMRTLKVQSGFGG